MTQDPLDREAARRAQLDRLDEYEAQLLPRVDAGAPGARKALDDVRAFRARILGGVLPDLDGHDVEEGPPLDDRG